MQTAENAVEPVLELEMQELETMEAPGWATVSGFVFSASATGSAAYSGYTVATSTIVLT